MTARVTKFYKPAQIWSCFQFTECAIQTSPHPRTGSVTSHFITVKEGLTKVCVQYLCHGEFTNAHTLL